MFGGSISENMNEVERVEQEEVKEKMTNYEGEKRVAFLFTLAEKLRAQLQGPRDDNLEGVLDCGQGRSC